MMLKYIASCILLIMGCVKTTEVSSVVIEIPSTYECMEMTYRAHFGSEPFCIVTEYDVTVVSSNLYQSLDVGDLININVVL